MFRGSPAVHHPKHDFHGYYKWRTEHLDCTLAAASESFACLPFIGVIEKCVCGVQQQRCTACCCHDVQESRDASHTCKSGPPSKVLSVFTQMLRKLVSELSKSEVGVGDGRVEMKLWAFCIFEGLIHLGFSTDACLAASHVCFR